VVLLAKLLAAHFIGDYLLQPKSWVAAKESRVWRAPQLYLHTLIHLLLILLIIDQPGFLPYALLIAASHLIIDGLKVRFQTEQTRTFWYFTDQALHVAVLLIVWNRTTPADILFGTLWQPDYWIPLAAFLFLTMPAATIIRFVMLRWTTSIDETRDESLKDAGTMIGILERLFIFFSILGGFWQTIGFLLAAKSVFRFGDLTRAKDRKLTEYIMIGTLLSFSLAVAVSLLVLHV